MIITNKIKLHFFPANKYFNYTLQFFSVFHSINSQFDNTPKYYPPTSSVETRTHHINNIST